MHEYGHHAQYELGISDSPGGEHSFSWNLADRRGNKSDGVRLAWGEAWPSVFGAMAQAYYSDLLTAISTVGDTAYSSYNNATLNYNTTSTRNGEAVEASIMGVLWDLYDSDTTEAHDKIALGHQAFWNLIANSQAKTFSDFANHYYSVNTSSTDKDYLGSLIQYYRMSPENINHSGTLVSHTAPTFTWTANETSNTLRNNRFDLIFYNSNRIQVASISGMTTTTRTLSAMMWNAVLNSTGATFWVSVTGSQTSSPSTGGYTSAFREFAKPILKTESVGGTVTVAGYYGHTPNSLSIPTTYNGVPVTAIGPFAFANWTGHTVSLPAGVTNIGNSAFSDCRLLKTVTINRPLNQGVIGLGTNAFDGTDIMAIYISDAAGAAAYKAAPNWSAYSRFIVSATPGLSYSPVSGGYAVSKGTATAEDVMIPESYNGLPVVAVAANGFKDCTAKSVLIPTSVTSIGDNAFSGANKLTKLTVLGDSPPTLGSGALPGVSCPVFIPPYRQADYARLWNLTDSRFYYEGIASARYAYKGTARFIQRSGASYTAEAFVMQENIFPGMTAVSFDANLPSGATFTVSVSDGSGYGGAVNVVSRKGLTPQVVFYAQNYRIYSVKLTVQNAALTVSEIPVAISSAGNSETFYELKKGTATMVNEPFFTNPISIPNNVLLMFVPQETKTYTFSFSSSGSSQMIRSPFVNISSYDAVVSGGASDSPEYGFKLSFSSSLLANHVYYITVGAWEVGTGNVGYHIWFNAGVS